MSRTLATISWLATVVPATACGASIPGPTSVPPPPAADSATAAPEAIEPAAPESAPGATAVVVSRPLVDFCYGVVEPEGDGAGPRHFAGHLAEEQTYRAELAWEPGAGRWWPTVPLCVVMNQGVAIRFENVADFPALADTTATVPVVFDVVRTDVASYATEERFTEEWICRIVSAGDGVPAD